jgi:ATP-binding cassette subfamily F protein 3
MATADGDALDRLMRRHGELTERMEFLGGGEADRLVETVLSGIRLREEFWEREARTLSGGERGRAALSRELVASPDLLLLDEPTNHLDLAGIEWLEAYLRELRGAVLIVSHDRRLLDRSVDAICDIERGELKRYPGGYSRYLELKRERYETELREWENQRGFLRKEQAFIKKHMGSQRTGEAKGRQKRLQRVDRLERPHLDVRKPVIRLAKAERGGELVIEATDLTVGYGDNVLFRGETVRIGRGERIGIVGPNGAGKTSLLRVLAGLAQPLAGRVATGHRAVCGYFDQDAQDLDSDATCYEIVRRAKPQMTDEEVRSHLARFLFRGEDVSSVVGTLSGGERARLYIARLVLGEPSWLAFDEPTNHLDLAARTALEEFLGEFHGALLCVSHDRAFLDGLCTSILEVKDGAIRRFPGNYSEYRARVHAEQEAALEEAARAEQARRDAERKRRVAEEKKQAAAAKKGTRKATAKRKPRNPWALERLEKRIMELEEKRGSLLEALATEEVYKDTEKLRETQFDLAELERELEEKNATWEGWE